MGASANSCFVDCASGGAWGRTGQGVPTPGPRVHAVGLVGRRSRGLAQIPQAGSQADLVASRPDFSVFLSSSTTGHSTLWCDTAAYSGTPKPKAIEGTRSITGGRNRPEPLRLNDGVGILGEPHTAGSAPDPPPPGRRAGAGA